MGNPRGHQLQSVARGHWKVKQFKYFGGIISHDGIKSEINARIALTSAAMVRLKPIWRGKNNHLKKINRYFFMPSSCRFWCIHANYNLQRQSKTRYLRQLFGISYTDPVTNKLVPRRASHQINGYKDV